MEELSTLDFDELTDDEFEKLEHEIELLTSAWQIMNLRGNVAIFHDDQHIGEKRRELNALKHPGVNVKELMAFRANPVVDSLEGNSLIHLLTTPVIEINQENTKARATWWSFGVEGLSKFREQPTAIISVGMVPGVHIVEDGEWRILWGMWQRTTKNEYHAGWVHSMIPTVTRPALTKEQDKNMLGKYAYQKDEVRRPVPEPPRKDTWDMFPDEMDHEWLEINLGKEK